MQASEGWIDFNIKIYFLGSGFRFSTDPLTVRAKLLWPQQRFMIQRRLDRRMEKLWGSSSSFTQQQLQLSPLRQVVGCGSCRPWCVLANI
jgi:hypothetical protein